jgi:hypothetical protein
MRALHNLSQSFSKYRGIDGKVCRRGAEKAEKEGCSQKY